MSTKQVIVVEDPVIALPAASSATWPPTPVATWPVNEPAFLRFENLSKSYQEGDRTRVVLQNADAQFDQGEFVAILGRSGSGKSTLLNLLSGIDRADSGRLWLGGQELSALDDRQRTLFRRRNIGFVFQFFNLIPTLTVWENVTLPLELNGAGAAEIRQRAEPLLEAVGLLDRSKTFPDRLSGGEQQRVALARALVHDPLLVLADEPTGNLDEQTGSQILGLLDRMTRQAGKNLIMVTHSTDAASYADRIVHLKDGKLVEREAGSEAGERRAESDRPEYRVVQPK